MKHLGDITKISGYEVPIVDVVVGGSPCQDLSMAGKRAGLDGERSGLFMEQIRIIKEMRENDIRRGRTGSSVRPRYMVWKNVPGAFSSNKGEDFRVVLEETAKVADKDAVIPSPPKGKWTTAGCVMGDGWSIAWRVLDAQFYGVPQRRRRIALVADFGGESASEILFVRKSVSRDTEQGKQERQTAPSDAEGCIGANDIESIILESNQNHATIQTNGICTTLPASMGMGGGYVPMVINPAYTLKIRSGCEGGGKGARMPDKENFNCVIQDVAAVDCRNCTENSDINGTLQAHNVGGTSLNLNNVVRIKYMVRRLTPLERERLQGYPDGWTDIGEWVDSKGKTHKTSDASRYKALGNSIAIPPWKWVMKRISACYERDATLASLFDGIGGFPYIWEQINGKGSCLWASEIEEFPIAVTKMRIGGEDNG